MVDWDAALYRRFEAERTRPARDLLDRVDLRDPGLVVDLGCGPGNSTELLARRFPHAEVIGLDTSDGMLASARARLPHLRFEKADVATWRPERAPDLLYANASLQWVGDHGALFPRLLATLAPSGVMAIQMPNNREEASHRLMRDVAALPPWSALIGGAAASRVRILSLEHYYDALSPEAADVDLWRTIYHHPMDSAGAIVSWVSGTGLRPFVGPLPDEEKGGFLAEYERRIDRAYPPRADGKRLLAFPRLFIVARKRPT